MESIPAVGDDDELIRSEHMTTLRHFTCASAFLFLGCSTTEEPETASSSVVPLCKVIRTTEGDIESSLAGIVLPHEHLLMDFWSGGVDLLGVKPNGEFISATPLTNFVDTTTLPNVFSEATGRTIVE